MSAQSWRSLKVISLLCLFGVALACETWRIWPQGAPLLASVLVIALAAAGVWRQLRVAWLFALLLFAIMVALCATLLVMGAPEVTKNLHGDGFGPLGGLVLIVLGIVLLAIGGISLRGAIIAFRACRQDSLSGRSTWLASLGAILMLSVVSWSAGFQYFYRSLWVQHSCRGGNALACISMASNDRFAAEERRDFARQACELGNAYACKLSLGGGAGTRSDSAAEQRCVEGDTEVCKAVGEVRLSSGDQAAAKRFFELACQQRSYACGQSANAAARLGKHELHEYFARRGCDLDDGTSCVVVLRHFAAALDPEARDALQLKTCLLTDVNECFPLIRSRPEIHCPTICLPGKENRSQSCYYCGLEAQKIGKQELAQTWFGQSCANGFRLACEARAPDAVAFQAPTEHGANAAKVGAAAAVLRLRRAGASGSAVLLVNERQLAESGQTILARVEQVCAFDAKSDSWRTVSARPLELSPISPGKTAQDGSDRVIHELSRLAGLYWVRWTEQPSPGETPGLAVEHSGSINVGPILCNDLDIREDKLGRMAACVNYADHAEARLVPDPRTTCLR